MLSDVPQFPEFRPLRLEDRELVARGFAGLGRECSEFTFACFYLFRASSEPSLSRLGDALLFRELCRGTGHCLLPPMFTERAAEVAAEVFRHAPAGADDGIPRHMYGVTSALWEKCFAPAGSFERRADPDNFDYVYDRQALAELKGQRYHSKKNHVNSFLRSHNFEYRRLTPDLVASARDLADRWCQAYCKERGLISELEVHALKEGLGLAEQLDLVAAVILVDGRVEALSMGERLSGDVAAVHFEKASPGLKGLAQLMTREFAAREFADCRYLNREQDLGDPGLRKAKASYYPVRMVEKYAVALAGSEVLDKHFAYLRRPEKGGPP